MNRKQAARYDAALARIWKKLTARFPIGCAVKMTPEGARRFPRYANRIGKVVGYYKKVSPKVLFDGRRTAGSWHSDFLQKIAERY